MEYLKLLLELWQLKKNEKKSRAEIIEIRDKKLRRILLYAYDHSVYYKTTFEQAGLDRNRIQTAPLSAFPTIDKKILLEHFDEMITVNDVSQEALRRFDRDGEEEARCKRFAGIINNKKSLNQDFILSGLLYC